MICEKCGIERTESDFLGRDVCFRCQYRFKIERTRKKVKRCRQCNKPISSNRWIYCSTDCACIGKRELDKRYSDNQLTILK
jgi:hypothetical protein